MKNLLLILFITLLASCGAQQDRLEMKSPKKIKKMLLKSDTIIAEIDTVKFSDVDSTCHDTLNN